MDVVCRAEAAFCGCAEPVRAGTRILDRPYGIQTVQTGDAMIAAIATASTCAGLLAGGCAYAALWPESQLFGRVLVAGSNPSEFALTFDDGPNDPWTPRLLEMLAEHQVRATFFLIGEFVRERPAIARQIVAA